MLRLLSRVLNALTFGSFDETLCARMARKRAACRFCRCVCRALEFVPTFGSGHCDDELEMYEMKLRLPGPMTVKDTKELRALQKEIGALEDGKYGTQMHGHFFHNQPDDPGPVKPDIKIHPIAVIGWFFVGVAISFVFRAFT